MAQFECGGGIFLSYLHKDDKKKSQSVNFCNELKLDFTMFITVQN